jgi:hypothetical protein
MIHISKHFEEWDKAGMKMMDCPLYEVAMKVESYTGSANGGGSANVTKNLLTLGGTNLLARRGKTLNASPVDATQQQFREADVSGKVRGYYNTDDGSKRSTSPVFAY